jgi:hypothetical protein
LGVAIIEPDLEEEIRVVEEFPKKKRCIWRFDEKKFDQVSLWNHWGSRE